MGVQVVLEVGADVWRHHHRTGLAALGGVDLALTAMGGRTAHASTSAPSLMSLRRSSITSPQRSPHHAEISTRARNSGLMASATVATSPTERICGWRWRGWFIAPLIWAGFSVSRPSPTAVAQTECSDHLQNIDSGDMYTEAEVIESYDRDMAQLIADNPAARLPTYDEWLDEYRDLGLLEVNIDECIDEIFADDASD